MQITHSVTSIYLLESTPLSLRTIRYGFTTMAEKELQVLGGIFELSQVRTSFQCSDQIQSSLSFIITVHPI